MWCRVCQQDVPATTISGKAKHGCPRCGQDLLAGVSPQPVIEQKKEASAILDSFGERFDFDTWEVDEQLRHIERVLQFEKSLARRRKALDCRRATRFDSAHDEAPRKFLPHSAASIHEKKPSAKPTRRTGGLFAASCLVLAVAMLVCGGVLLGGSIWGYYPELWHFGLPIALGGQIFLVAGLLLQLDRLHREHRSTVEKVTAVDKKLRVLKTQTTRMESARNPLIDGFHSPQDEYNANPQAILSDLKSRLELLANQFGPSIDE
jgi:hypothetical protein